MPRPGSHHYDVRRARLRAQHDNSGTPDHHADAAANEELRRDHPPIPLGDPDRAAGPTGVGGDSRGTPDADDRLAARSGVVLRSTAFVEHDLIPSRYTHPERTGDEELSEFFRRAQNESRKGAEQGKQMLAARITR
ncbi:hypothetical protein K1T35_18895 [Pseudonocardia sp. DSM 110487]|uniref:hypothetical protein n=1 Tax=Pseudonocardia sp. DSM 110487 TaxID=2865833 RepID=UPI001C69FBF5|nr:hypothetical protein [Pseudonocardia sp. DSM 110487]QYN39080.1 hypothetical protein K1T35_18895 [Pseudonocardia sp. DSM 110487]